MTDQSQGLAGSAFASAPAPEVIVLERWSGPICADDPNANFKTEVALYAKVAPLTTLNGLSEAVGLPVGALAHFILARYASSASAGLLEIGPEMVRRLQRPIDLAESDGTDRARLEAYHELHDLISWLFAAIADLSPDAQTSTGIDAAPPERT